VGRFSSKFAFQVCALAAMLAAGVACAAGDGMSSNRGGRPAVYQRRAFDWMHGHGSHHGGRHRRDHDHAPRWVSPQVTAGWFQRPYPYHLDYYRMRYGGSYAPYFGNLYGPPQVVTAPPYYGPYYGGYDAPNGFYPPAYQDDAAPGETILPSGATPMPSSESGDGATSPAGP
jgi:hypothetical protein